MNYEKRRRQLVKLLKSKAFEAALITNPVNVRYLTGFTGGDSYLLVSQSGDELLLSDPRYEVQLSDEAPGIETLLRAPSQQLMPVTAKRIAKAGYRNLACEPQHLDVSSFDLLTETLEGTEVIKEVGLVEGLRAIKDAEEIKLLRRAVAIAERAFRGATAQLSGALTEIEVAHEIERLIRGLGGEGCSFEPIVAVGPRAALPHAPPGHQRLSESPFILIDWGAVFEGYRSDLTRVVVTSRIPAKFERMHETVLAAQKAAIDAIRPGVSGSEVDAAARAVIDAAGMGKRFNHGLGHGIGLDIHENPRMGRNADVELQAGMVVTVEPGVYYPGFGGVRIEDDILVTKDGNERLSSLPRELEFNQFGLF